MSTRSITGSKTSSCGSNGGVLDARQERVGVDDGEKEVFLVALLHPDEVVDEVEREPEVAVYDGRDGQIGSVDGDDAAFGGVAPEVDVSVVVISAVYVGQGGQIRDGVVAEGQRGDGAWCWPAVRCVSVGPVSAWPFKVNGIGKYL